MHVSTCRLQPVELQQSDEYVEANNTMPEAKVSVANEAIVEDQHGNDKSSITYAISGDSGHIENITEAPAVILNSENNATEQNDVQLPTAMNTTSSKLQKYTPKAGDLIRYKVDESSEWVNAQVLAKQPKQSGKNKGWINVQPAEPVNAKQIGINIQGVTELEKQNQ